MEVLREKPPLIVGGAHNTQREGMEIRKVKEEKWEERVLLFSQVYFP